MKRLKLLYNKVMLVLHENVDLFTAFLLMLGILFIFLIRWDDWGGWEILDLFFLIGMAAHIGCLVANAIYRRRTSAMLRDQVEREAQMLERFRATITDMMRLNK